MPTPTLTETQRLLWQLITAPSGVADGLRTVGDAGGLLRDGLEAIINGDPVLPAVRRLDVYANMYFFRLRDALAEDFPVVRTVVGADAFHNLVTDYLRVHPPTAPSLRDAGQLLPRFLDTHLLGREQPFLADLARVEWAVVEAFDAADAAVLPPASLAVIAPEAWATLRFRLTPSLQLLALDWDVLDPWQRAQAGQAAGRPAARPTWVRVWRHDLRVWHRAVAAEEFAALHCAASGEPFATMCERVADVIGTDRTATCLSDLLQQWLADGLLTAYLT